LYNIVLLVEITMTMHLLPPMYSTTGKRKGKQKFASAEAKRKSEQLDREWKELLKRQGIEQDEKKRKKALSAAPLSSTTGYSLAIPAGRNTTAHIKSLNSGVGTATLAPPKVYTGTKVMGIATMHKSNAVPVFSNDEAKEISSMRR
jgi:hypothetical protein